MNTVLIWLLTDAIQDGFTLSFRKGKYELCSPLEEYVGLSLREVLRLYVADNFPSTWIELDDGCAIRRVS